jgi:hypothetical protein
VRLETNSSGGGSMGINTLRGKKKKQKKQKKKKRKRKEGIEPLKSCCKKNKNKN